jgi:hypothetical protein
LRYQPSSLRRLCSRPNPGNHTVDAMQK